MLYKGLFALCQFDTVYTVFFEIYWKMLTFLVFSEQFTLELPLLTTLVLDYCILV